MIFEGLVNKEFWEERHDLVRPKHPFPMPNRYYLDFELDSIFQRYLSNLKNKDLIEVGCGSSVWLPYFHKEFGLNITGLDYSQKGIAMSRIILEKNQVKGRLVEANVFEMSEKNEFLFDVVFSLGFIEHFNDPLMVLTSLKRLLAPNGLLITWLPNTKGCIIKLSQHLNSKLQNFYYQMDLGEVLHIHQICGLDVLESHYTQFLDFNLITLPRLPKMWLKWIPRLFRGIGLVFIVLGKYFKIQIREKRLSAGIVVIARRTN